MYYMRAWSPRVCHHFHMSSLCSCGADTRNRYAALRRQSLAAPPATSELYVSCSNVVFLACCLSNSAAADSSAAYLGHQNNFPMSIPLISIQIYCCKSSSSCSSCAADCDSRFTSLSTAESRRQLLCHISA